MSVYLTLTMPCADGLTLHSDQYRNGGPAALVVISGAPPFYIPTDVANALQNMYTL